VPVPTITIQSSVGDEIVIDRTDNVYTCFLQAVNETGEHEGEVCLTLTRRVGGTWDCLLEDETPINMKKTSLAKIHAALIAWNQDVSFMASLDALECLFTDILGPRS
jgi:hypothetical protein